MGERPEALRERDAGDEPFALLRRWVEDAGGAAVPQAVALATASAAGAPSVRMVLLKGFGPDGFRFFTGLGSRKARELADNPRAALLFHWEGRQARVEGRVEQLPPEESDAYFASRPRGSQLAAWASRQSEPFRDRVELEDAVRRETERWAGRDVPRPPHWGGYRLLPERVELWQHRDDRLHDRLLYERAGGGWSRTRLGP